MVLKGRLRHFRHLCFEGVSDVIARVKLFLNFWGDSRHIRVQLNVEEIEGGYIADAWIHFERIEGQSIGVR